MSQESGEPNGDHRCQTGERGEGQANPEPTTIAAAAVTQIAVIAVADASEAKIIPAASPQNTPPATAPTKTALCQSTTGRAISAFLDVGDCKVLRGGIGQRGARNSSP